MVRLNFQDAYHSAARHSMDKAQKNVSLKQKYRSELAKCQIVVMFCYCVIAVLRTS